jgi:hypothetical protein
MSTTFEKVSALNVDFGNPVGDISNPNVSAIRKQALLCLEEAVEMVEAAYPGSKVSVAHDQRNMTSTGVDLTALLDAQGDLTTVNDGMAHVIGVDGNAVYDLVDASNRTKFITQPSDTDRAMQYYYNIGFLPEDLMLVGEYPTVCIKVRNSMRLNGKQYPAGKFLKNMVTFTEPDFSLLLPK